MRPARFRAGLAYGVFGTDLSFSNDMEATIQRRAVSASFEYRLSERWNLVAGAGTSFLGRIDMGGERHTLNPGWLGSISGSYRMWDGQGTLPFFGLLTMTIAVSGASTSKERSAPALPQNVSPSGSSDSDASFFAADARLGFIVGKTFWNALTPYAGVRVFGGPIFWRFQGQDIQGTDQYHYQLALGFSSSLPGGVDLFAEAVPLGERAVSVGGGLAF